MPFNGSGTFSRVYNWVTDKNNSVNITASRMDTEDTGFAAGLSQCVLKDGTQIITANLPMAGFKFTGLGAGSANTDSATVGQIQNSTVNWIASGGTADIITATYSPAVTALVDGMELDFRATGPNTVTTPTFSPNGITAHTITKLGGAALAIGDTGAALAENKLRYNLANTRWELMNPANTSPFVDSAALVKGSSDATKLFRIEVDGNTTGTTRVMTPPDADFTAVGTATTQTLTNKALSDSTTTIVDDGDATKKLAFQCSSITTGTTRTVTIPDKSGTMAMTSDTATTSQSTPSNPTATTSSTGVMMGLAGSITPSSTGKVLIIISGNIGDAGGGATTDTFQIRYGTGSAPANGAALTGTATGAVNSYNGGGGGAQFPFSLSSIVSGLTPATPYWVDISLATSAGISANVKNVTISAVEI